MKVDDLYRTMSTRSLGDLLAAFLADRANISDAAARAFVDGRVRLLRDELQRREAANEGDPDP